MIYDTREEVGDELLNEFSFEDFEEEIRTIEKEEALNNDIDEEFHEKMERINPIDRVW